MDLTADRAKLNDAMKTVGLRWEETQSVWNDSVRREFEETIWSPLEPAVQAALRGINQLNQILAQARRDCS